MKKKGLKEVAQERPTELTTGVGLATLAYGFLAERGLDNLVALVIAVVIGFAPLVISNTVDLIRHER